VQGGAANAIGAKTASIFCTIYAKDDRFVKTGSGQTQGKHSKRDAFSQVRRSRRPPGRSIVSSGNKTVVVFAMPV
jgi:hypothetical protein